jgi:hypothetical protein
MPVPPPRWREADLEAARQTAIEAFRSERMQEPLEAYLEAFDEYRGAVEDLLEATVDLTQLSESTEQVLTDPALLEAVRYLAGPPISADDLKVLANVESLAAGRLRADHEMARSKEQQEQAVEDRLVEAGFEKVSAPRSVPTLAAAPAQGRFCRETTFGTRKADLLIGLWDDRKMPLECKVSNSATNSIKRINNDAAVKAVRWIDEFGTQGVVPAAVLSGVYKLSHLVSGQANGLTLIWAHDLDALIDWIETTRQ